MNLCTCCCIIWENWIICWKKSIKQRSDALPISSGWKPQKPGNFVLQ